MSLGTYLIICEGCGEKKDVERSGAAIAKWTREHAPKCSAKGNRRSTSTHPNTGGSDG